VSDKVEISDMELGESELISRYGDKGRIMHDLIKCEGRAVWIPDFVNRLFAEYLIEKAH
jgi:hypothetical protein